MMPYIQARYLRAVTLVGLMCARAPLAQAQSPPTVSDVFAVQEQNSVNNGNLPTGNLLFWGAESVVPSTSPPSYGLTFQCPIGATCPSPTPFVHQQLLFRPFTIEPNAWITSRPYDPSLTGAWNLKVSSSPTFAAGSMTSVVQTPAVGSVAAMPYVGSMTVQGAGLTPTISWTLPTTGPAIDNELIEVQNNSTPITASSVDPTVSGTRQESDLIYSSGPLGSTATSFTIPSGVLSYGDSYSIGIELANQRSGATFVRGCFLCSMDSISQSFFDFTPINGATLGIGNAAVNLPTVQPITTPNGLFSNDLYHFNVSNVGPNSTTFIDPLVATGFMYTKGTTDPNFKSVDPVTDIGDGIYGLSVWTGSSWVVVDPTLDAGTTFDFTTDSSFLAGVSEFEITGIDPGLDPTDITAFVTGLTFMSDGSFTGTMQPIVVSVPEPGSLALLGSGLIALVFVVRRRMRA